MCKVHHLNNNMFVRQFEWIPYQGRLDHEFCLLYFLAISHRSNYLITGCSFGFTFFLNLLSLTAFGELLNHINMYYYRD